MRSFNSAATTASRHAILTYFNSGISDVNILLLTAPNLKSKKLFKDIKSKFGTVVLTTEFPTDSATLTKAPNLIQSTGELETFTSCYFVRHDK